MREFQKLNRKLIVTAGSLLYLSLLGAFAAQSIAANRSSQLNRKAAIIEKIGRLPEVPINFDNSIGSPLVIETALVKVISGADYTYLTGDSTKVNWHSTFPTVTVTNSSNRKVTRWGLMIKSATDSPDVFRGVMINNHPLPPGGSYTVDSTYFLAVVRTTEVRDGKSIPVAKIPGYDSISRWLPGSASDLKVIAHVADFEGGGRWVIPEGVKSLPDKKKNEETESLIERAGYAPPEIAADIILQLIESNTALDANRKRQLLEELFDLSYRVQYKLKLRESIDVSDSRIGNLGYAYSLNLDTLSIQCRTIKLMIPINKGRAVDLFRRIRIPDLDPLSCQDLMVPDISIYYDTLRDIVATALVDNESKRIESHNLIWNAISNISSPLQLGSVARMLVTLDLSSDDLSYFMSAFAARLKNLSSDPRSLAWSLRDAGTELRNLAMKCRARGVGYEGIIDGYRTFLVENMPKCLCHDFSDASKISEYVKKHTDNFNALLNDLFPDGNPRIFPLKAGQLNPKKIEKSPAVVDYTETPFGAKLLRGIRNLNFDQNGKDRSLAEKENTAWKHELKNYYHLFNSDIKDENMSEVDNFHNKCAIYGVLLQTVPRSNSMYEDILKDYLSFISQNRTQQESVIEWLWQARVVLLRTNLTKQSPDAVLKSMSDSGDEMLKLIAETRMFIAKIK